MPVVFQLLIRIIRIPHIDIIKKLHFLMVGIVPVGKKIKRTHLSHDGVVVRICLKAHPWVVAVLARVGMLEHFAFLLRPFGVDAEHGTGAHSAVGRGQLG